MAAAIVFGEYFAAHARPNFSAPAGLRRGMVPVEPVVSAAMHDCAVHWAERIIERSSVGGSNQSVRGRARVEGTKRRARERRAAKFGAVISTLRRKYGSFEIL